jgi:hypothetical protein
MHASRLANGDLLRARVVVVVVSIPRRGLLVNLHPRVAVGKRHALGAVGVHVQS